MSPRRKFKVVKADPGELRVGWGGRWYDPTTPGLIFNATSPATNSDRGLVKYALERATDSLFPEGLLAELARRGFDVNTLQFSIRRKEIDGA